MPSAHVVIDYQNIHLTGHGRFCPTSEGPHVCLVHPLFFARQVIDQRNLIGRLLAERRGETFDALDVGRVLAFRGQPSNARDPLNYRRTQAQQSEWTRDHRVSVGYRTLKYYSDGSIKEKGIDVLVALNFVAEAAQASNTGDVVILAAHDTDQEPALEMALRLAGDRVETTGWDGERVLRVPGQAIWHTKLHQQQFENCRDPRTY